MFSSNRGFSRERVSFKVQGSIEGVSQKTLKVGGEAECTIFEDFDHPNATKFFSMGPSINDVSLDEEGLICQKW